MNILITQGAFNSNISNMLKHILKDIELNIDYTPKAKFYDLVVLSGGEDVSPQIYGEINLASYPNPERDKYEIKIINKYLDKGSKFFGICRGMQLLSAYVYRIKLVQDIHPRHNFYHDTLIGEFGINLVNSLHHQGVEYNKNLPYKVLATHNGIVEGFIDTQLKIHGVQFHPELIFTDNNMKKYLVNLRNFILE